MFDGMDVRRGQVESEVVGFRVGVEDAVHLLVDIILVLCVLAKERAGFPRAYVIIDEIRDGEWGYFLPYTLA